jgi:hypothetical protein
MWQGAMLHRTVCVLSQVVRVLDTPVEGESAEDADEAIEALEEEMEELEGALADLKVGDRLFEFDDRRVST